MSLRQRMTTIAVAATVVGTGLAVGTPAYAADASFALRNQVTGLCLDWPGVMGPNGKLVYTRPCNGSATQQWSYDAADQSLRNTGTDYCLNSGYTTAVWIDPCLTDEQSENWLFHADGRVQHLFWDNSGLEDEAGREYVEIGLTDGRPNEVWDRLPA